MDIKNITGLEKPLEKLVETISSAVGVVGNHIFQFDAVKAKRIGKAEASVERDKIIERAEGQKEAITILDRAGKRFALEQYNKQINLENILVKTKDDLNGKEVSKEPVEKDWTTRFIDISQNISREEMQDILAKILSGEIQKPGSFSYQVLEIVKYLSQKDLQKFLKFLAISTDIGVMKLQRSEKDSLEKYGLTFNDYLDLSSVGLFNQSSTISYNIQLPTRTSFHLNIGGDWFWIFNQDAKKTKKFNFGLYVFSRAGKELRALTLNSSTDKTVSEYKKNFIELAKKKGFEVVRR
ncbi:MAG: DUF2806 domain-containing protein [Candidatus Omnitrophica bacterium]|nr:DUF2806 domain-containing protein [Candidatus Omnitrophota bacterium]